MIQDCLKSDKCDHIIHNSKFPRKNKIYEAHMHKLGFNDIRYIEKLTNNAIQKSKNRIDSIISSILKLDVGKSKKYEYREEKYELKIIIEYVEQRCDLRYTLSEDDKIYTNKLDKIIPGCKSGCCNECDGKICFTRIKVPRKYIAVTKYKL